MKKKNTLFIALTILGLALIGCQSQGRKEPIQQETINEATEASGNNKMEAVAPKSDDIDTNSTTTSETATVESTTTKDTSNQGINSSNELTEEEAKKIALKDANVKEKDITNIRIKKDMDNGRTVYEVEFYVQNKEYDYEIDITTGEIINKDYEIEDDFYNQTTSNSDTNISQEEAINIVLKRVPGASKENVKIELDIDDGYKVYEGEIYYNQTEYEFELNAQNGKILKWSEDRD